MKLEYCINCSGEGNAFGDEYLDSGILNEICEDREFIFLKRIQEFLTFGFGLFVISCFLFGAI